MVEQFESLKEAILKSEKQFSGGRAEIARLMGLSYDAYRNRLREDREDQQFSASQLEDIQFITGTAYIAQYFANKANFIVVSVVSSDLDSQELSEIQISEAAALGEMNMEIAKALQDGQIDHKERKRILEAAMVAVSKLLNRTNATIEVYKGRT